MRKIFSLLVILGMLVIVSCSKEEPEALLSAEVIREIEVEGEIEGVEKDIISIRLCHDTDNGMIRWVGGTVFGYDNYAERFEISDYCFNTDLLIEYYCEDEIPQNMTFVCEHGCKDNHCQ